MESGFGYGVIGADLHVFGDGLPLYVLENWRVPPAADPAWLWELPSRMLNAKHAVVHFTGRANELAELHQWRQSGPRLAARWLYGAGGQGKTRLAAQFAKESDAAGWKVVTAIHGPGTVLPPPGSQDMRLSDAIGLLIIIDYADRWPLTHLTWLFSNRLLRRGVPTRVLLLARTPDSWPAVRASLANHHAGTSSQLLEPLPDSSGQRAEMFTAARDSFASRYQVEPVGLDHPGSLDHPDFGLTLAVHMAALVAVDAYVNGHRPPQDVADLTVYLLDREHLHWARLYGDATHELDVAGRTYQTPPEVMNRVVFTAALTGAVTYSVGATVLGNLRLRPETDRIIADHGACYPPANQASVLEPLYPDRLAEDFLALTMPGHPAEYPAQAWAPDVAATLVTRQHRHSALPDYFPRSVIFLAAAAGRWPHVGENHLYPLLHQDPQLALDVGSAVLTTLANNPTIDMTLLEAIEARFPEGRHADLDPGIAIVTDRLTNHRLNQTEDPAERALLYSNLNQRLSYAGMHVQALAASEEAVVIWRELAEADGAYEDPLAGSLESLGVDLSSLGRHVEALAASEEAVVLYRRLAEADPVTFEGDLAGSLINLGADLSNLKRYEEALAASEEAVVLYRRLANSDPAVYREDLAWALDSLGTDLSEFGQHKYALVILDEAVQARRRLAKASPAEFEADLAHSLNVQGILLWSVGRHQDALRAIDEAVALYRRLAVANPLAFEADFAWSLDTLGSRLPKLGQDREAEALAASEEAVAIYRRLAVDNPTVYEANFAHALNNVSIRLTKSNRHDEALAASEEAVVIYRRLAEIDVATFKPDLANSLETFAGVRTEARQDLDHAKCAIRDAIEIYQRLNETQPGRFKVEMAITHRTAVQLLGYVGCGDEAPSLRHQIDIRYLDVKAMLLYLKNALTARALRWGRRSTPHP
ncbi:tetratricopeptide repeat protein [Streptomyces bobili]|uniref:tetratricopeptide repeat protein n=1 Tax=Streptomyces bobili TaxID=67280 RepID=UPI0033BAEAC1